MLRGCVVAVLLLAALAPWPSGAETRLITASEAATQAAAGTRMLIDVRAPAEWRASGVARDAKLITIHGPGGWRGFLGEVLAAVGQERATPIALICAAGVRSSRAAAYLALNGFTDVRDVSEGMFGRPGRPGYIAAGLPVEDVR